MTDRHGANPHSSGAARPAPAPTGRGVRTREDWRLIVVILTLILVYGAVGTRMGLMALTEPVEPRLANSGLTAPVRGEIADRHGRLLAANLPAYSLFAHPHEIKDPLQVARDLAVVFPDETEEDLYESLSDQARFSWVKRPITPRQRQEVLDLGHPGLKFGARAMRIYPAGRPVAHIVGGVKAESEAVRFAELAGSGGVEGYFDERLRDPAEIGAPLELSIDLSVQTALREVMADGVRRFEAKGGTGILMDVATGEVLAMVSVPDFDPNHAPEEFKGRAEESPRFNRAALGRYELGSTFKVLTAAFALEEGLVTPDTMFPTKGPFMVGRTPIRDAHRMPEQMSVTEIVVRSSNVGTAHLAMALGTPRLKDYLNRMGFFEPLGLELTEAVGATPILPDDWTDLSSVTISYGHGLSASPIHLASAFATLAVGGQRVRPTLMKGGHPPGERVLSQKTSQTMLRMLREVVRDGTGKRTDVPGYEVGGKTGTADKPKPGGYHRDRVIATFAAVFPTSEPRYSLVISLDEPVDRSGKYVKREASRTAVPVTALAIQRIAPLLGLRPKPGVLVEPSGALATLQANGQ